MIRWGQRWTGVMKRIPRLVGAAVLGVVTMVALVVFAGIAQAAGPTAAFSKDSDWGSGYQGKYTITNGGTSTITGWTVEFDLPSGTTVGTYWDSLLTTSGSHYTFKNREYNGTIAVGASVSFGFVVSGAGTPAGCKLNGGACGGGTNPSPSATSASPSPTPSRSTSPPPPPPPPGSIRFAPYVDITRGTPSLPSVASATGQKTFTIAFISGSSLGCDPQWGGTIPLNDPGIIGQVNQLRSAGGSVVVASGGALSPYLESSCGSASALVAAYKKTLDAVGSNALDIDLEASVNVSMVNTALKQLQTERGTRISYTLMIQSDDYGLTPALGVDVLKDAAAKGVRVDVVNPMVMDFGGSKPTWGESMVAAAESTHRQMKEIWPGRTDAELYRMLGATAMIGRNDTGPVTAQSDARTLVNYANSKHLGYVSFWSIGRDNGGCPSGGVRPDCSGISQSNYEFTGIFRGFTG